MKIVSIQISEGVDFKWEAQNKFFYLCYRQQKSPTQLLYLSSFFNIPPSNPAIPLSLPLKIHRLPPPVRVAADSHCLDHHFSSPLKSLLMVFSFYKVVQNGGVITAEQDAA